MAKRKYDLKNLTEKSESSFELDLAPMLALMVTLIPIMLLSTVFVRVAIIDTPLPQVVQQAIQKDMNKKDRKVNLTLKMTNSKQFRLVVREGARSRTISISKQKGEWNLPGLYSELVKVKVQHPEVFKIDLIPSSKVSYEDIVKVMDEARKIKDEKVKVYVKDEKTQQKVETNVMFPNVIFANVVEG